MLAVILYLLISCISYPENKNALEIPATQSSDFIIDYMGFTLCYDTGNMIPRWVAYELLAEETDGPYTRKGKYFRPDEKIRIKQADNGDYKGSGWSKGHMAPAGDFKWSDDAMWETFYYTNCVPQNTKLNNGSWNVLENKVRSYANKYGKVYVVTGPIVNDNMNGVIGTNNVVVPDAFYKALMIIDEDQYYAAGFVMYNSEKKQLPTESIMTIDELENITGLDFFPLLDDKTERRAESELNIEQWR